MKLVLRAARLGLGVAVFAASAGACYTGGNGNGPPTSEFYFPVGLAVSPKGNVLYAVNSDFDLQWNGGTLQSYNLYEIRHDAAFLTAAGLGGRPFPAFGGSTVDAGNIGGVLFSSPVDQSLLNWPDGGPGQHCFNSPPDPITTSIFNQTTIGVLLGQNCAPPFLSQPYQAASVVIGAFATDLQLSLNAARLFAPIRGSASVTWADVAAFDNGTVPTSNRDPRFQINCDQDSSGRCSSNNQTGDNANSPGNTRALTMPGEPFGLAQTEDGTAMVVTSQTNTQASLLTTGVCVSNPCPQPGNSDAGAAVPLDADGGLPFFVPTMQFVANGLDNGGNGIALIPHDPNAVAPPVPETQVCPTATELNGRVCARPAFLMTSRDTANLDLLRYYNDDGSDLHRPYLQLENRFPIPSNAGGSDSRGIAFDPTPRFACQQNPLKPLTDLQCGQVPARMFFANRSDGVLATGTVGGFPPNGDGDYNPDLVTFTGNVPVCAGASRVYVAPIVDAVGKFEVRVFVVCFDVNQIVVYDPNAQAVEKWINVGVGPFAMAFDPFDLHDVASSDPTKSVPPIDTRYTDVSLRTYRYAYVASFTQSYLQVIDLDNEPQPNSGLAGSSTFESVVFTVGNPTPPKGQ
jgi:hypothetical protein